MSTTDTDEYREAKIRKEARVSFYLYSFFFFVGLVGVGFFAWEWKKAPDVSLGFDLAMACSLLLLGAYGFTDAKRTLHTGDNRPSFGVSASLLIALFSMILKDVCEKQIPHALWPWMLALYIFLVFFVLIGVAVRLRHIRVTQTKLPVMAFKHE